MEILWTEEQIREVMKGQRLTKRTRGGEEIRGFAMMGNESQREAVRGVEKVRRGDPVLQ